MTTPSRYAVPLQALDQVHVEAAEQVEEQNEPRRRRELGSLT